eukprot:TRINITY_DN58272_c0_g1_i1.p1 TRINITY_DN58272_c0_g1~~TRINITY_DN58272_c0_g1_i1.p1  ORF type:complete len:825 (+),score=166.51 TRINITY_DN58272_c0_g1_i1:60-2477(+)
MSVLEDCKFVLANIKAEERNAAVREGPYPVMNNETMLQKLRDHDKVVRAGTLWWVDLAKPAVEGVLPPHAEALAYGKERFGQEKAPFHFEQPIHLAVTGLVDAPSKGTYRKISNDKEVYAFMCAYAEALRNPATAERDALVAEFRKAAGHVQFVIKHFKAESQVEREIFISSVQLKANFDKDAEVHGLGGWEVIKMLNRARALGDSTLLARVQFARNSELDFSKARQVSQGLLVFDRVTAADVSDILDAARAESPRGTLDTFSKLLVISEKAGSYKSGCADMLRFLVKAIHVRGRLGLCDGNTSVRQLKTKEIPMVCSWRHITQKLVSELNYDAGTVEADAVGKLCDPYIALGNPDASLIAVSESCRSVCRFVASMFKGEVDGVLAEIAGDQTAGASVETLWESVRLDLKRFVQRREAEREQAKNLVVSKTAGALDDEEDKVEEVAEDKRPPTKEERLADARVKHVRCVLDSSMNFICRPTTKQDYTSLVTTSKLVVNRAHVGKTTAWVFDASGDSDTAAVAEQGHRTVGATPPMLDGTAAKLFWDAFKATAADGDVAIVPTSMSKQTATHAMKGLEKLHVTEIHLMYAPTGAENRKEWNSQLHETVLAFSTRPLSTLVRPRLHYQLTTTGSDTICMIERGDGCEDVSREVKEAICGDISAKEKGLKPSDLCAMFQWDKTEKLWRELLWHFGITSAVVATLGKGGVLRAARSLNIPVLALAKNERHLSYSREVLVSHMVQESEKNQECSYFISRSTLIDNMGLEEDNVLPSPAPKPKSSSSSEESESEKPKKKKPRRKGPPKKHS